MWLSGQEVVFSVTLADNGAHHLDYVDIAGGAPPVVATSPNESDQDEKQAVAPAKGDPAATPDGATEGKGVVESATGDELVVWARSVRETRPACASVATRASSATTPSARPTVRSPARVCCSRPST